MTGESVELAACPFCPIKPPLTTQRIVVEIPRRGWAVRCIECGATGPLCEKSEQAIPAWNTRATPSRIATSLPTTDYNRSFLKMAKTCDFPGCERPTAGHPSFPQGSTRCWTHIPKPSKRPKDFGLDEKPDFAHIDRIIAERDRRKAKDAGVMYRDLRTGAAYP